MINICIRRENIITNICCDREQIKLKNQIKSQGNILNIRIGLSETLQFNPILHIIKCYNVDKLHKIHQKLNPTNSINKKY